MFSRLRVSNNGNLVETTYYGLGKVAHRVVLNTAGVGDRRARKAVAREEWRRRTKTYHEIIYTGSSTGVVKTCHLRVTLKI